MRRLGSSQRLIYLELKSMQQKNLPRFQVGGMRTNRRSYAVKSQKGLRGKRRSALSRSIGNSNGVSLAAVSIVAVNSRDSLQRNAFSVIGKRTIK